MKPHKNSKLVSLLESREVSQLNLCLNQSKVTIFVTRQFWNGLVRKVHSNMRTANQLKSKIVQHFEVAANVKF